jgi:hypothetical protein
VSPQVTEPPAARAPKLKPPETAIGVEVFVIEPFPSWPLELSPQQ